MEANKKMEIIQEISPSILSVLGEHKNIPQKNVKKISEQISKELHASQCWDADKIMKVACSVTADFQKISGQYFQVV